MPRKKSLEPIIRENMTLPASLGDVMPKLIAGVRVNNQINITKKEIFVELIKLLKMAKIDTKLVQKPADITAQLVEYIKKKK